MSFNRFHNLGKWRGGQECESECQSCFSIRENSKQNQLEPAEWKNWTYTWVEHFEHYLSLLKNLLKTIGFQQENLDKNLFRKWFYWRLIRLFQRKSLLYIYLADFRSLYHLRKSSILQILVISCIWYAGFGHHWWSSESNKKRKLL